MGAHLLSIVAQAGGVALVSVVSIACAGLLAKPVEPLALLEVILAVAAAYGLGALLGVIVLGRLFYPLVSKLAGAPFSVGDRVIILRGRRKRRVAEIYEIWDSRGQVRLRLSDDEREAVADVFSYYEVMKTKEPNPQGGANGKQPLSPETNRASAAAASHRSP